MHTTSRLASFLAPLRLFLSGSRQRTVEIIRDHRAVASLSLELADTLFRRAKGLMGRAALEGTDGMLFVYPWSRTVRIWMAGTLYPLDVVFIDRAGTIVKVATDLQPLSKKWVSSDKPVKWVIEIAAGRAAALGLTVGDQVQIETLGHL